MKPSDSTEMDRLLRRYARRNAETLSGGDGQGEGAPAASGGAHMDADELNAYAEGALPEAARVRYFAHLADCDTCRKLVTELTLASGITSEEKQVVVRPAPAPSKSWREWLAALLSPPVLRYAVPALALFGVIIVAVVVMRSRRETSFIARNNETTDTSVLKTPANSNSSAGTSSANTSANAQNHPVAVTANSNIAPEPAPQPGQPTGITPPPAKTIEETQSAPAPPPPLADEPRPVVGQAEARDKKQGTFGQESKSGEEIAGSISPQPTPVLAAPPAAGPDNRIAKREDQARPKNSRKDDDETAVATNKADAAAATSGKPAADEARRERGRDLSQPSSPTGGARAAAAPKSKAADIVTEKELPPETRSVNGRQFRRQGNAWVDTAYNSSRSTVNVPRGSEQYRALVADESGLRAITQQLGGEVIVVWKGRAYRFY